jgi:hypothetical protein
VKNVLAWIILALVVLWVIDNPHHASELVHKTGHAVDTIAHEN